MALSLSSLSTTRRGVPPILAIYGTPGVGKTSLAAEFPSPIYLHTEGEEPPNDVDMPSGQIESFEDLLNVFAELLTQEHSFQTVIIDSLDAIEPLVWAYTCARMGWEAIAVNEKSSPTAYGVGYLEADNDWREYFSALAALRESGVHVVQILHSETKSFEDPMADAYDKYRPKLHKRALAMVIEKSHALLFLTKRMSLKQVDKGFGKKESKPDGFSGADRVIHTDGRAGFEAKNRLNMPASIPYKKGSGFKDLSKFFYGKPSANDNTSEDQSEAA